MAIIFHLFYCKSSLMIRYFNFFIYGYFHGLPNSWQIEGKEDAPSHKFFFSFRNINLQKGFLEKEMTTHSSILAWRIPGTEEPRGLLSMGSHRVGHDWSDLAAAAAERVSGAYDGKKICVQCRRCRKLGFDPWVRKRRDLLEKGMATLSSSLPWWSLWTEECGGLKFVGLQRVGHGWETKFFF